MAMLLVSDFKKTAPNWRQVLEVARSRKQTSLHVLGRAASELPGRQLEHY